MHAPQSIETPALGALPPIKQGAILKWFETIKSSTERTGLRSRRRVVAGLQEITGVVEIVEGDFLIVKVVRAQAVETITDTEFRIYSTGDIVRKKASTFMRRQGKVLEKLPQNLITLDDDKHSAE